MLNPIVSPTDVSRFNEWLDIKSKVSKEPMDIDMIKVEFIKRVAEGKVRNMMSQLPTDVQQRGDIDLGELERQREMERKNRGLRPPIDIKQKGDIPITQEKIQPNIMSWDAVVPLGEPKPKGDIPIEVIKDRPYAETQGEGKYRGVHKAPTREFSDIYGSLDEMNKTYPDDIYTDPQAWRYYGHGTQKDMSMDKESIRIIRSVKGNPDAEVTIYRSVPKGKQQTINEGDWVTINKQYAKMHGERFDEGQDIIEKKVKASEIFTEGNSIHEFGYSPESKLSQPQGEGIEAEASKYKSAKSFVGAKFNEWFYSLPKEEQDRIGNDLDLRMKKFNELTEELTPIWKAAREKNPVIRDPNRATEGTKKDAMLSAGKFVWNGGDVTYEKGLIWNGNDGLNLDQLVTRLEEMANPPKRFLTEPEIVKFSAEAKKLLHELKMKSPEYKNYQEMYSSKLSQSQNRKGK